MSTNPYKAPCKNCSCKGWIQELLKEPSRTETLELYQERKETGETFQCYLRPWRACCIFWKCLEYIDKNREKVFTELELEALELYEAECKKE